jgi:hypothetical protein
VATADVEAPRTATDPQALDASFGQRIETLLQQAKAAQLVSGGV